MLVPFINFVLYSNIFIAVCAIAMTIQTYWVLGIESRTSPALLGLVFFSTWVIYALHRLVSLSKVDKSLNITRFKVIGHYHKHIQLYSVAATVGLAICFFNLARTTQLALVLPAILSLGYVLPFLGKQKKRLRDIHFIKIFLIAVVWSYVTVLLPVLEHQLVFDWNIGGMLAERMLFIFIITLPFDLRDWEIDQHNNVHTIPAVIGAKKTVWLGMVLLLIWLAITFDLYNNNIWSALFITAFLTSILLGLSPNQKKDYFFTGLVDGTMILQAALVYLLMK